MPQILGIGGSPRKGGNSDILLKHVLEGAREAGASVEAVQLRNVLFQSCIGCERCRKDKACTGLLDGMQLLYPKILESKGLVLASPTHTYTVTAWMKAFIDRLYCFYDFADERPRAYSSRLAGQGRKAVLAAVCEQMERRDMGSTLDVMRLSLESLGYEITAELPVFGLFDRGAVALHEEILGNAKACGRQLAGALAE